MEANVLISELIQITKENKTEVLELKKLSEEKLNAKLDAKSWSILECIEHLNYYGYFYLPEIKTRIDNSKYPKSNVFKSNWLGNYFSKSMLPKEKLNTMKTLKSMNPIGSTLTIAVLDVFIEQQNQILDLLNQAKEADLTRIKTSISISKLIKLRLGDTLRVVVYHNLRHVRQALKVLN